MGKRAAVGGRHRGLSALFFFYFIIGFVFVDFVFVMCWGVFVL